MIRKTINLLVLYFLQFYLNSLRGKEYFARINLHIVRSQSQSEPGVFGSLEPEPLEEKKPGAGAAWEKNQEPELLEKKSGAGAAKNLPAPLPWKQQFFFKKKSFHIF